MFDLNLFPESSSNHLVEAEVLQVAPVFSDSRVKESKVSDYGALPPVLKDHDEASTITVERPAELLHSRSSLSSTLSFEPTLARQLSKSSVVHEEDDVEREGEVDLTTNLRQNQDQPYSEGLLQDPAYGAVYQFIATPQTNGISCAEAGTLQRHEHVLDHGKDDPQPSSFLSFKKSMVPQNLDYDSKPKNGHGSGPSDASLPSRDGSAVCLSLGGTSADGSAVSLSLGGSSVSIDAHRIKGLARSGSIFKRAEVFGLALGRPDDRPPLSLRKSSDLSPFWRGKLRTDAPLVTPVDAYCLGNMKPNSRLKKLPHVLGSRKFLKLEEFMKSLLNGVMEPLTQFKPSLAASLEEVNRFNLMVEALSHGSGLSHLSSVPGLDLGKKKASAEGTFPYSAALISWEEDANYSVDAKLYLISSQCFQELVKNGQTNTSLGALEETDVFDPDSLYGIFCRNSPGLYKDKKQAVDLETERNKAKTISSRRLESRRSTPPLGKKVKDSVHSASPVPPKGSPRIKGHSGHSDGLTTGALIETRRVSSRDSFLRSDLEASVRSSKRRLERQASSIDNTRDVRSRYSSRHMDDLFDDDIDMHAYQKLLSKQREKSSWSFGRHSERLECRSDRNKATIHSSKERESGKDRVREYQRSSHHESERGSKSKTKEEYLNHDRVSFKERDRSSKDKVTESLKTKLLEKGSKSSSSVCKAASPNHEFEKLSRKRERDDDKEINVSLKRSREVEATVLANPNRLAGEISCDVNSKATVEQSDQECLPHTHLKQPDKLLSLESNKGFLHLLGVKESDNAFEVKEKEASFLNRDLPNPLLIHANFDSIFEMNKDAIDASVCETEGVSEMDTGFNLLKVSLTEPDCNGIMEDLLLSKAAKEEGTKERLDFVLDGPIEKETRTWLMSKQNSLYLLDEYGVDADITFADVDISKLDSGVKTDGQNGADALISSDISKLTIGAKTDSQNGPLQVRISMVTSEDCDAAEAKWFVEQAASIVKSVASRGVYVKCLWYEGPVQIHSGDGAPSVPAIVKRIKGEDGKNLERMQDETGVMIGVVLRKSGVSTLNEAEPMSRPRFIGLRLKCIRRRGLLEASKEAEALLECVAEHFSKELATHIATHIADLQESAVHSGEGGANQDPSLSFTLSTKDLLPSSPVKADRPSFKSSSGASSNADDAAMITFGDNDGLRLSGAAFSLGEPKTFSALELEGASRPLYVSNLPEHITPSKIRSIIESAMKEKLELCGELDSPSDLVVDVKYKPDKCCAFVEMANNHLLRASLKLYAENKEVFHGLSVEEGLVPFPRAERQGSFSKGAIRNRLEHVRSSFLARRTDENSSKRQTKKADNESDSDISQDVWYADAAMRPDYVPEKPRPLYLTELMRNASGPAIKQLFENVINTYIGPSLANASGKQLVLDVRYVPTRGCAFVDLATPELVEFMLDLHSRRPEAFLNMKMELGRKAVPYSAEDDGDRRPSLRNRDGKAQSGYRLTTSGSWKRLEKRSSGAYIDNLDDSEKGDDLMRQISRLKKQRSDPEKTIYADRLPESASVGMIKKIFERVLLQHLTQEEQDAIGEELITEVRHVPSKYCAFVVFATEDLTRRVLELYNRDEDVFECMHLKPHFHSRLEDLYKEDVQEADEVPRPSATIRERTVNNDIDDLLRFRESEVSDLRSSRLAVQRAISATAFKEVDRRRSVYVDRIPEDLNELSMTQLFEKIFRRKKHSCDSHMVSQVAYFRDKFDPSKLCAFVEIKTEEGTQDLVDFYNANQDAFHGMRVRPGFKYNT